MSVRLSPHSSIQPLSVVPSRRRLTVRTDLTDLVGCADQGLALSYITLIPAKYNVTSNGIRVASCPVRMQLSVPYTEETTIYFSLYPELSSQVENASYNIRMWIGTQTLPDMEYMMSINALFMRETGAAYITRTRTHTCAPPHAFYLS